MTDVLKANYADLKTVKTRSTVQIILEMPIEALTDVVALLGAPVPGNEVWVAVARLRTGADGVVATIEPPAKRGTLAQQAGILCAKPAFLTYIKDVHGKTVDANGAAELMRQHCGVGSRRDLDTNADAGARFRDIKESFDVWMMGIAA